MPFEKWLPTLFLATLAFSGVASAVASVRGYQTQTIEGWTVHIDDRLLAANKGETDKAVALLAAQLKEMRRTSPPR